MKSDSRETEFLFRVSRIGPADGRLVVVSAPVDAAQTRLERLTAAEQQIAEMVICGEAHAAIAQRRGTSARTVANQVAAIFRKLGVRSRAELVAALTARDDG